MLGNQQKGNPLSTNAKPFNLSNLDHNLGSLEPKRRIAQCQQNTPRLTLCKQKADNVPGTKQSVWGRKGACACCNFHQRTISRSTLENIQSILEIYLCCRRFIQDNIRLFSMNSCCRLLCPLTPSISPCHCSFYACYLLSSVRGRRWVLYIPLYSVRGWERSELGGSHGCLGRLWDRFLWPVYCVGTMLWTEYRPVIKIGPKGALGSHEIRPIHSALSLGQSIEEMRIVSVSVV